MPSLNNIKRNKVPSLSDLIHVWNTQEGVDNSVTIEDFLNTFAGLTGDIIEKDLEAGSTQIVFDVPSEGMNLIDFYSSDGSSYIRIDTGTLGKVTLTYKSINSRRRIYCRIVEVK